MSQFLKSKESLLSEVKRRFRFERKKDAKAARPRNKASSSATMKEDNCQFSSVKEKNNEFNDSSWLSKLVNGIEEQTNHPGLFENKKQICQLPLVTPADSTKNPSFSSLYTIERKNSNNGANKGKSMPSVFPSRKGYNHLSKRGSGAGNLSANSSKHADSESLSQSKPKQNIEKRGTKSINNPLKAVKKPISKFKTQQNSSRDYERRNEEKNSIINCSSIGLSDIDEGENEIKETDRGDSKQKSKSKLQSKIQQKPQLKPQPKSQPKPQLKPQPKPQPKSQAFICKKQAENRQKSIADKLEKDSKRNKPMKRIMNSKNSCTQSQNSSYYKSHKPLELTHKTTSVPKINIQQQKKSEHMQKHTVDAIIYKQPQNHINCSAEEVVPPQKLDSSNNHFIDKPNAGTKSNSLDNKSASIIKYSENQFMEIDQSSKKVDRAYRSPALETQQLQSGNNGRIGMIRKNKPNLSQNVQSLNAENNIRRGQMICARNNERSQGDRKQHRNRYQQSKPYLFSHSDQVQGFSAYKAHLYKEKRQYQRQTRQHCLSPSHNNNTQSILTIKKTNLSSNLQSRQSQYLKQRVEKQKSHHHSFFQAIQINDDLTNHNNPPSENNQKYTPYSKISHPYNHSDFQQIFHLLHQSNEKLLSAENMCDKNLSDEQKYEVGSVLSKIRYLGKLYSKEQFVSQCKQMYHGSRKTNDSSAIWHAPVKEDKANNRGFTAFQVTNQQANQRQESRNRGLSHQQKTETDKNQYRQKQRKYSYLKQEKHPLMEICSQSHSNYPIRTTCTNNYYESLPVSIAGDYVAKKSHYEYQPLFPQNSIMHDENSNPNKSPIRSRYTENLNTKHCAKQENSTTRNIGRAIETLSNKLNSYIQNHNLEDTCKNFNLEFVQLKRNLVRQSEHGN